jgi:hypothetical protein
VKRAYGDWTTLTSWKKALLDLSIRPVQVFAAVKGKNAADLALAIGAMDLLHSGAVDGFALVSSDSDFTRLAERIREAGLTVHGYGEEKKDEPGPARRLRPVRLRRVPRRGSAAHAYRDARPGARPRLCHHADAGPARGGG